MHLASHGLMVATLDHSEVVAPEVAGNVESFTANRVLDARFLLDDMLARAIPCAGLHWTCPKPTRASRLW